MKFIIDFMVSFVSPSSIIMLLVLVYLLWCLIDLVQTWNVPPGPWFGLPLLGHILYVSPKIHEDAMKLAEHYGPLVTVRLGSWRSVLVNGQEAVKQALINKSLEFSGRPMLPTFLAVGMYGKGVAFSNGTVWKLHRRIFINALRTCISDKIVLETRVLREIKSLLAFLQDAQGKPFNPEKRLTHGIANIVCGLCFGQHFEGNELDSQTLIETADEIMQDMQYAGIIDIFPFLKFLPNVYLKRMQTNTNKQRDIIRNYIREHEKSFDPDIPPRDFIDALLLVKQRALDEQRHDVTSLLDEEHLTATVRDMFVAGIETTSTTLRWALLFLVNHPEYQEELHAELNQVIAPENLPSLQDTGQLPLLCAAILETIRLINVMPIPRVCIRDTTMMGYQIPKGTILLVNLYSVHRDPKSWDNPGYFNPHRFIDRSGRLVPNVANFYPFSAGRRVCPGDSLAKAELFLFLASILHKFKLKKCTNTDTLSEEGEGCFLINPKPFQIRFVPRKKI